MATLKQITVNKANVYEEASEQTAYDGAKAGTYQQVALKHVDLNLLERFWVEACNTVTSSLREYISSVSNNEVSHGVELSNNYEVTLKLPSNFDFSQIKNMETSLFNFFVNFIIARWYHTANKPEAESVGARAQSMLENTVKLLYHRVRPQGFVITDPNAIL